MLIIALVSSAGGLDALIRVLAPLERDLPAAVIALQHINPDRESGLVPILASRCQLTVRQARHGDELRPATVYVAPPGQHTLITAEGKVALIVSGASPPSRPSADLLLTSLALCVGPRAVAVVLSGAGHDGATGASAVHDFGGVVIAADEASSQQFSMPKATIGRDDATDHICHVDDIAELLTMLVRIRVQAD